ncbi:MAG: TlpA disulfide reductase family protein [Candidatus Bipolaricaulota bacterium]
MTGTKLSLCVISIGALLAAAIVSPVSVEGVAETERFPCMTEDELSERTREPDAESEGTEVGDVARDFTLANLDGEAVSLSQLQGCVVVIEFWASWCPPCWDSAVHLEKLRREHEERGLVVIGISLDRTRDAIDRFLEATGEPGITVLWGSLAEARQVAETYGVSAIPHALVIDRENVIRFVGHPVRITDELLAPFW